MPMVTNNQTMAASKSIEVLHVDDELTFIDLTEAYFDSLTDDLNLHKLTDPTKVQDFLKTNRVDCIISDMEMPEQTGLDLLSEIRPQHPDIPIIILTSSKKTPRIAKALAQGATDYVHKRGDRDTYAELYNRITEYVNRQHSTDRVTESETAPILTRCLQHNYDPASETLNGEVMSITGHQLSEFTENKISWADDIVHPSDRDIVTDAIEAQLKESGKYTVTYRIRTNENQVKWVWEHGESNNDADTTAAIKSTITEINSIHPVPHIIKENHLPS